MTTILIAAIFVAAGAGCTADQARGISRLQQLEKDFDRGQPDYYCDEDIAGMRSEFPNMLAEIRDTCTDPAASADEIPPTTEPAAR